MVIPFIVLMGITVMAGDPLGELLENFEEDYNAAKPPSEYSSINSDYKLEQAALGTMYTTKAIGLLYRQNQKLLERYEEMLQKYDTLIDQNKKIIELLSTLVKYQQNEVKKEANTQPWKQ